MSARSLWAKKVTAALLRIERANWNVTVEQSRREYCNGTMIHCPQTVFHGGFAQDALALDTLDLLTIQVQKEAIQT